MNRLNSRREASKPDSRLESLPIAVLRSLLFLVFAFCANIMLSPIFPPVAELGFVGLFVCAWGFVMSAACGVAMLFRGARFAFKGFHPRAVDEVSGSIAFMAFAFQIAIKCLHLF